MNNFEVNWDNAQYEAMTASLSVCWYDEGGNELIGFRETLDTFERPTPTPQVEVGQVWRYKPEGKSGDDYEVTEINTLEGKLKIGDEWQEDVVLVTYENIAQDVYRRTLSDFLAKFERIS